jgi:two-component sensor histidine kinase
MRTCFFTMTDQNTPPSQADHGELGAPERLKALLQTGLMDTPPEEMFDRAVRLAAQITGRPVALLSLVDDARQFFKAQVGLSGKVAQERQTPLTHSFCKHVVTTQNELIVTDAGTDDRVRGNKAIEDHGVAAYLGVPVRDDNGEVLGSLCVIDNQPHEWSDEERRAMQDLRAMVEADLSLRHVLRQNELLLGEFNHRINNLFSVFMGMVRMTARGAEDAGAMSESLIARLSAMDVAHRLVMPVASGPRVSPEHAELKDLLGQILEPFQSDAITMDDTHVMTGQTATTAFALIFHELATNALKYGALSKPDGQLSVDWRVDDNTLILTWRERLDGIGVSQPHISASTGTGFGTTLLKINIEQELGGTQERVFSPDEMTLVLRIPMNRLAT